MKKIQVLFILLIFAFGTSTSLAQKKLDEGTVEMTIQDLKAENPEVTPMLQMLKGTKFKIEFNKDNVLMSSDMMSGMMKTRTFTDKKTGNVITLMDMMGQKMMATVPASKTAEGAEAAKEAKPAINYDKEDKKKILDYDCYKATMVVKTPDGQDMTMEAYVTEEVQIDAPLMQGMKDNPFDGKTPLQYTINVNQKGIKFSMTIAATDVFDYVKDGVFDFSTDGYNEMTPEQLQQMGGGFGF